jgi:hypothetical protein
VGIRLIVEVLDTPLTLTHRERCLLVALAEDASDDTALTWSSVQDPKILRRADLSRTQLYQVVKDLTAKGALTKVTSGQKYSTAKYRINPQGSAQRDTESNAQSPTPRDADRSQCPAPRDPIGRFSVPPNRTLNESQSPAPQDTDESQSPAGRDVSVPLDGTPTPLLLKTHTPAPPPQPDLFDAFWTAYPRKVGKAYARTAWTKALKRGADPAAVVAAVPRHAAYWHQTQTQAQYIPYPSTWLNGDRYEDDLQTPQQPADTTRQPQHERWADQGVF